MLSASAEHERRFALAHAPKVFGDDRVLYCLRLQDVFVQKLSVREKLLGGTELLNKRSRQRDGEAIFVLF